MGTTVEELLDQGRALLLTRPDRRDTLSHQLSWIELYEQWEAQCRDITGHMIRPETLASFSNLRKDTNQRIAEGREVPRPLD